MSISSSDHSLMKIEGSKQKIPSLRVAVPKKNKIKQLKEDNDSKPYSPTWHQIMFDDKISSKIQSIGSISTPLKEQYGTLFKKFLQKKTPKQKRHELLKKRLEDMIKVAEQEKNEINDESRFELMFLDTSDNESLSSLLSSKDSNKNVTKRAGIRRHPEFIRTVDLFFTALRKEVTNYLDKFEYIAFMTKMFKCLLPNQSREALKTNAELDWQNDADEDGLVNRQSFRQSMGELCDSWCERPVVKEYTMFLKACQAKLSINDPTHKILYPLDRDELANIIKNVNRMHLKNGKDLQIDVEPDALTPLTPVNNLSPFISSPLATKTFNESPLTRARSARPRTGHKKKRKKRTKSRQKRARSARPRRIRQDVTFLYNQPIEPEATQKFSYMDRHTRRANERQQHARRITANRQLKQRLQRVSSRLYDKTDNAPPGKNPPSLENVILNRMQSSHDTVYPKPYTNLCNFLDMGIVGARDLYSKKRKKNPLKYK